MLGQFWKFWQGRKCSTSLAKKPSRLRLTLEALEDRAVPSANPMLIKDVNSALSTGFLANNSPGFVEMNGALYFTAKDDAHGTELWRTDGTSGGTALVKDIVPGTSDSLPDQLTVFNGELYFTSQNLLWKSNGTEAGTQPVFAVPPASGFSNLTVAGSSLYFFAFEASTGYELWRTNGTELGTSIVLDINPGPLSSNQGSFLAIGSQLYFTADDGTNGQELWTSNGSLAGTFLVKNINPASASSSPAYLTNVGGALFFAADDGTHGYELWTSNGTGLGTTLVKDVNPNAANGIDLTFSKLVASNGLLYVSADDGTHGQELWVSNGTEAGTLLVKDLNNGPDGAFITNLTDINGIVYFGASDGISNGLYKSSGTAASTEVVKMISADSSFNNNDPNQYGWLNDNGTLVFRVYDAVAGLELYTSNGTSAGTTLLKDLNPGLAASDPQFLARINGKFVFLANDGTTGQELWASNGTSIGTTLLKDFVPGTESSNPSDFIRVGPSLFFTASTSDLPTKIYVTDGTSLGTHAVTSAVDYYAPSYLTEVGGVAYFAAFDLTNGFELWKTDGSFANTTIVKDINPGFNYSFPTNLKKVGSSVFFTANDGTNGFELWTSNGTALGTHMVANLTPGVGDSLSIGQLTDLGGVLYFSFDDGTHGTELWRSDGTELGTVRVTDINATGGSFPQSLVVSGGGVYFTAYDGASFGLYKAEIGGVTLLKDFGASVPSQLTSTGDKVYFSVGEAATGVELWSTDGTPANTTLFKDINPGTSGSLPVSLTVVGTTLYFVADDGTHGEELWKSDGTPGGTVLVTDLTSGLAGSAISHLTGVDTVLFFTFDDGVQGEELWRTEGRTINTLKVGDIAPGILSSSPHSLAALGTDLAFVANDGTHGLEPFLFRIVPPTLLPNTPTVAAGEGGAVIMTGTYANNFNSDNVTLTADFGTISKTGTGSGTWSWTTATGDGPAGPFTVTLTANDGNGGFKLTTFTYSIIDVAPTLALTGPNFINLNQLVTLNLGTVQDPGSDTITGYMIHWGDGSSETGGTLPASLTHTYTSGTGPFNVAIDLTDEDGTHVGAGSKTFQINQAPTDIGLSLVTVPENSANGTVIGSLSATDPNGGVDSHSYSLVSGLIANDNASFSIDIAGRLVTAASFNFEIKSSYLVRVRATDQGGLVFEKEFTISVTDRNEAPTNITLSNATVQENLPSGAIVGAFSSTDPDASNTFTYTLVAGTGSTNNASFTINANGELVTTATFSVVSQSSYAVRVRSTDQGNLTFEKEFTITITAGANNAPTNIALSLASLAENQTSGTIVGAFSSTDPDASNTFTYSLVAGTGSTDNTSFTINGAGQLVTTAAFDFETKSSYAIRVRTTDQGLLTFEKQFTITVTNVNESPTNITLSNATVQENLPSGAIVGVFSSTDPDASNTFTYSLVAGTGSTGNASFTINANGELVTAATFSVASQNSYAVRVRSTDQGNLTFEKEFTITITAGANNAPTNIALSLASLAENQTSGTIVGAFSSTDPDAGNTFTYSLVAGTGSTDNTSFTINGAGQLVTTAAFDFETKSSYAIRVRTTDQGLLTFEKQFTITVTNVNESPTNITLANSSVAENLVSGTVVGAFSSTDPDASNTFTYSLVSGSGSADNASFTINGAGQLVTAASFDFETKSSYFVRVRSTDQGSLTFDKAFTIAVSNVNEAPTNISISVSTVAENLASGTVVGAISSTDPDTSNTFTYTLVTGAGSTDNASFTINGAGQLVTAATFNFELKSSYAIRVRSTDQGTANFEKQFTVTVTNVNEAPTDLALTPAAVAENQAGGTIVGAFSSTDPDVSNTFTYTLVAGTGSTDNASFTINGSGQLVTAAAFNFEVKPTYAIRVRATDQGTLTFEKSLTVQVSNVNETPTDLALSALTVPENRSANTVVGSFSTTDPDASNTFTYLLVAGTGSADNASFTINSSGQLLTASVFNFENKSSYAIRVRSTDQGTLSVEKTFTITVQNLPEGASIVSRPNGSGQLWVGKGNGSTFTTNFWGSWPVSNNLVDVLTGDFNGDGLTDMAGRDATSGQWYVAQSTGTSFTFSVWASWSNSPAVSWVDVKAGDLNGDGKTDLLGRYRQTGQWFAALSNGSTFATQLWTTWSASAPWVDVQLADFTGDGKADLLGRIAPGTSVSGQWYAAVSTGTVGVTSLWGAWNGTVNWVDVRSGDLDGDGKFDLIGRLLANGQWWASLSTGTSLNTSLWVSWSAAVTWVDVQLGDLNADGKADLIGRVQSSGQWYAAFSTGTGATTSLQGAWSPAISWLDVSLADYDGDGRLDLIGRVGPGFSFSNSWWVSLSKPGGLVTTKWAQWNASANWVQSRFGNF